MFFVFVFNITLGVHQLTTSMFLSSMEHVVNANST